MAGVAGHGTTSLGSCLRQALVTMSPPPTAAPPLPGSSALAATLERAFSEITRLQADLLGADPRLVAGRLELASDWIHSDSAVHAGGGPLLPERYQKAAELDQSA